MEHVKNFANLAENLSAKFPEIKGQVSLCILTRISNYLVRSGIAVDYFENLDFLNPKILSETGELVDPEIENLSDVELRQVCKYLVSIYISIESHFYEQWQCYFDFSQLQELIVNLISPSPSQVIYNPNCRIGSIFTRLKNEYPDYSLEFIGQEPDIILSFLCKFQLFASGLEKVSTIYTENPLDVSIKQREVDIAISIPPFGLRLQSDSFKSLGQLGVNERIRSSEVAYVELMLASVKKGGKVIVVVPEGFLANRESEVFRKKYLKNDWIESIFSLPEDTFKPYAPIKTSIIVLNKNKVDKGVIVFDGKDNKNPLRFEKTIINTSEIKSQNNIDLRSSRYALKEGKEATSILSKYPQDEIKKIKDLIDSSISGYNYSPDNRIVENSQENLPYVRVKDLSNSSKDFTLDVSKVERVISREKARKKTVIDYSAVLVSKIAPKLKPTYFNFIDKPIVIGSDIIALKMKDVANVEYFLTQLHSRLVQIQVEMFSSGTTVNRINEKDFLNIQIILPPLEEQQRQILQLRPVISEKVLAEEKLIDAQYEVVANINHSLKNKLAVIINDYDSLVRFLRRKERNNGTISFNDAISANAVGDDIDTIEIITDRLKTNLLDASKVFKNAEKIQKQTLKKDVVELVAFFKDEVKSLYAGKNYSIEVIAEPNLKLNVWLDKDAFKDVIENLIENAKSHGFIDDKKNYRIVFDLSELADFEDLDENTSTKYARIIYKNDGKPFPKNFSFEDYKQFSNKAGKTQGTGIGGYVINKMIELHDGIFNFITASDDFTVEFEILLPLEN